MRIAHLCLSNWFVDGVGYQENELVRQHVSDGHEVLVIASTETHSADGRLAYTKPGEYVGTEGARVLRLPYAGFLPATLMRKLRVHKGVHDALSTFRPNIILFHGACGWELRTVARYAQRYPGVMLYVDSHEDWNNSARSFVARELLHRRYYGPILRSVLDQVERVLCVSTESIDFVADLYRVPRSKLEFFPLGGHPVDEPEYGERRNRTRRQLGTDDSEIIIVQSGRFSARKRLVESLRAFTACDDTRLRFIVVGVLQDDIREEAERMIAADRRVQFIGWRTPAELTDVLCAADVYLQPGTQSVTMQHSLCCRCAIAIDDVPAHAPYHDQNGWLINAQLPLGAVLAEIADADLAAMQQRSFALATAKLDYAALAQRILR